MKLTRSAGILLHPTSLPGPYGIGDFGKEAFKFIDWLALADQSWWQILPLGPTDYNNNPYWARSSWAGNPLLISLDDLVKAGDLSRKELSRYKVPHSSKINYKKVKHIRDKLLITAADCFLSRKSKQDLRPFKNFCRTEKGWLEDWSLFAALRKHHKNVSWVKWNKRLTSRDPLALKEAKKQLHDSIQIEKYIQFRFFEQWKKLYQYAGKNGIKIIGDVPIYCAHDSADVWATPHLFKLTKRGSPLKVSGVPPDYFAENGQLWGHPIYDWPKHKKENFKWWISRLKIALRMTDLVRIDHFRALADYWEIPARAKTARPGKWRKGPGDAFLTSVRKALGDAPFIAEDLGAKMKPAYALRDRWDLPGMKVLQFAFGGDAKNSHLPFRHVRNSVVYPGTHDNDTAAGWYKHALKKEKEYFNKLTDCRGKDIAQHMIRLTYSSPANLAIVPIQDILGLDSKARWNIPSISAGNYVWKLLPGQLKEKHSKKMSKLAGIFGREP